MAPPSYIVSRSRQGTRHGFTSSVQNVSLTRQYGSCESWGQMVGPQPGYSRICSHPQRRGALGYHMYVYLHTFTRLRPWGTWPFLVRPGCLLRPPVAGPGDNSANDAEKHPCPTVVKLTGRSIICIIGLVRLVRKLLCDEVKPGQGLAPRSF